MKRKEKTMNIYHRQKEREGEIRGGRVGKEIIIED